MSSVGQALGMRMSTVYGRVTHIDISSDIVLFAHSLIDFDISIYPHRGVRVIRDPRDILVSGYFYHQHCSEKWCINTNFDLSEPIIFPRVPLSQQHRTEEWKKNYLFALRGKSYQQNLIELDQNEGLCFEMDRYAEWTATAMSAWSIKSPDIVNCKLETIADDFDDTMKTLFRHLGLTPAETETALTLAAKEDIRRMDDRVLAANPHIHSRDISKWGRVLTSRQLTAFQGRHGTLISQLGYDICGS